MLLSFFVIIPKRDTMLRNRQGYEAIADEDREAEEEDTANIAASASQSLLTPHTHSRPTSTYEAVAINLQRARKLVVP